MSRKGESLTLSLSLSHQKELERLALEMGCTWGSEGNISRLMRAIAEGEIALQANAGTALTNKEKKQVERAIQILEKVIK